MKLPKLFTKLRNKEPQPDYAKIYLVVDREGMGETIGIVVCIDRTNVDRLAPGMPLRRNQQVPMLIWGYSAAMEPPMSRDAKEIFETLKKYVPVEYNG